VLAFENALHGFMGTKYAKLMEGIESSKDLAGDNEKAVEAAIQDFKATNAY
jgi:F-type H+-transporting ATPase subunit alpha